MRCRCLMLLGALAAVVAGASVPLAGQAPQAAGSARPRRRRGRRRVRHGGIPTCGVSGGTWFRTRPFERPKELGEKAFYTDAEVAAKVRAAEEERAARQAAARFHRRAA